VPEAVMSDPMFDRTGGVRHGRDGCRVPLPWTSTDDTTRGSISTPLAGRLPSRGYRSWSGSRCGPHKLARARN
jgi:hypothetical protein